MTDPANRKIKAKKLGIQIRDARQVKGKSLDECAKAIGINQETFDAYEMGIKSPSLPELEFLAYFLRVPVDHFLSEDRLLAEDHAAAPVDQDKLIQIRQKIIGVTLRKIRQDQGLSLDELSQRTGIETAQMQAYEAGQDPIPVPDLILFAYELSWPIKDFNNTTGPIGTWIARQQHMESFMSLGNDLQEFILKPVNQPYLEVAQRLSEMSVDKLRLIAETLLEITL